MRVSIVGAGYVGLVTGAGLAAVGHQVICVDLDPQRVEAITVGHSPILEPGLAELLATHVGKNLRATADLHEAVVDTDLTMIAVGTPFDGTGIDLGQVKQASRQIGQALEDKRQFHVVVVKSTVVPGTTEGVVGPLEGSAVADFLNPDRIVVGADDDRTRQALAELYASFDGVDLLSVDLRTAELTKYANNALLATLISFSNEMANLAAATGVDVTEVMRGVHLDRRLSPPGTDRVRPGILAYLEAGCGFGGSCLPKDLQALAAFGEANGAQMAVARAVLEVNRHQPLKLIDLLHRHFDPLAGVRVAVLGLAFKPGTDDIRESPAIPVIQALLAQGAEVVAFDPVANPAMSQVVGERVGFAGSLEEAVAEVAAVVIVTRWDEFNHLPEVVAGRQPQPVVVDGRRMLPADAFERYEGIGR
jgi:UDPglucose 6-dehydrogenase